MSMQPYALAVGDRSGVAESQSSNTASESQSSQSTVFSQASADSLGYAGRPSTGQARTLVPFPLHDPDGNQTGAVIARIESIWESILDDISRNAACISIPFRTRASLRRAVARHNDSPARPSSSSAADSARRGPSRLQYPGRTRHEGRKFTAVLRILGLAHDALVSGTIITKRNIYYQDTDLFRDQRLVDGLVDDIAFSLGVDRDALNIVAAAKGLVSGPICLVMNNGSMVSCGQSQESGTLIPPTRLIREMEFGSVRWLLVIEKEATFRTLAASEYYHKSLAGHGILVTAKGFPDLATRSFLHAVHLVRPQLPMYGLFDYDPDGIAIMRTYKYGSKGLDHETRATIPRLGWLGIRSQHVLCPEEEETGHDSQQGRSTNRDSAVLPVHDTLHHDTDLSRRSAAHLGNSVVPLTLRDRRMATNLLDVITQHGNADMEEMEQQRELQRMLMFNTKAEIQSVDHLGDMTSWLDKRLGLWQDV